MQADSAGIGPNSVEMTRIRARFGRAKCGRTRPFVIEFSPNLVELGIMLPDTWISPGDLQTRKQKTGKGRQEWRK